MQLEDYFEFDECDRIRVKGTRMAIEYVIDDYLQGTSPEEIVHSYHPAITLEQVFATLTYYLHNRAEIDAYRQRNEAAADAAYRAHLEEEPPEVVKRLRALRAAQQDGTRTEVV
ncbi:MAG: DUF433 domain-containing protein [Planctomycetes bacterium]|nr:DUF433 domain-containing protein [Planctomycetota bacterium]